MARVLDVKPATETGADNSPPPDANEPQGLGAAAAQFVDAEPIEGEPGIGGSADAPPPMDCKPLAAMMLGVLLARLERNAPEWSASEAERDSLAGAWGSWLSTMMSAPSPFAQALLVTAVFAVPRVVEISVRKARERKAANVDSDDRARGFGQREEPLGQDLGGQPAGL